MISKTPEELQFYEARMKYLHDEEARLMAAREEGREEGSLTGKIQLLQQLLGEEINSTADLLQRRSDELTRLFSELQDRLRSR